LHQRGFVHGDIRGFSTVFSDDEGNCRLIDFDFGGKHTARTTIKYPEGYMPALRDGGRVGKGGTAIEKWHDWYALAYLLFRLHYLVDPVDSGTPVNRFNAARKNLFSSLGKLVSPRALKDQFKDARYNWDVFLRKHESPTEEMIQKLKKILRHLSAAGFTCVPIQLFRGALDGNNSPVATKPAATGSPVKK
jgi:hypothetical protein